MWDEIFKRWVDLLFWWAPRTEETRPEKAEEGAPKASEQGARRVPEEPVEQQVQTADEVVADDLTVIKGIGPALQEKLRSLGIATFSDLARADPRTLTERLKGSQPISEARVRGWTEAARERAGPEREHVQADVVRALAASFQKVSPPGPRVQEAVAFRGRFLAASRSPDRPLHLGADRSPAPRAVERDL